MPANLENSAVATGLEKVSFHSNPKERQCQRIYKVESYNIKIQVFFKSCFLLFLRETSSKSSMKGEHQPWQSVSDRESTAFIRMKSIPKYETILPAASYYVTVALNHNQKVSFFNQFNLKNTQWSREVQERGDICIYICSVASIMSDSLRPQGWEPARFLCPWDSPGNNTGMVAMPSSRGISQPRDQARVSYVSCIGRWVLYHQHQQMLKEIS